LRWKSSLWKLIWKELLIYTAMFLTIAAIYRNALGLEDQLMFEKLARGCLKIYRSLPLTFLLGFYVNLVIKRWWQQYSLLPWPDTVAFYLRGYITEGDDEDLRVIRRSVVRYCLLSYILCVRRVSSRLRSRYPTTQDIIKSGLLRPDEAKKIGLEDSGEMYDSNWSLPLKWAIEICSSAVSKEHFIFIPLYNSLSGEIKNFRDGLSKVETYGHIPVPLVYTQVVRIAVFIYFAFSLVGEQWLIRRPSPIDPGKMVGDELSFYYPIFMTIKFLFYFGWLKVAETLYNPFGDDDDDFKLNQLIQRHFKVSLNIVDNRRQPPPLQKDVWWDDGQPVLKDSEEYDNNAYMLNEVVEE